ncbi:50S ribosomal subunit protein L21 [Desulfamplus magnetovallimortis]|uniref:Large ribosomal subunit protein bL21 n=1 Tax=Desulfamplus magnetovallimortis TaxID=1246637 RepID=A0A1W1H9C3_9BACT|nr:50S ribosomal protein L21 [Desulfamplus magnetovallimortis]SLM29071.1 50S ribosomal subunit protein L21 [Desulfamplus magnetovallimortis]
MYAVIKTGGKQYKVQEGDVLRFEKLEGDTGSQIEFNDVLLYSDGENLTLGAPVIESAVVTGEIVEQAKAKKILVFKYKRRKGYRKMKGHRQHYTAVKINSIAI